MPDIALSNPELQVVSQHGFAEIIKNISTGQRSLFALQPFEEGDIICSFSEGSISETPNYLTVQTGENKHITLLPSFLQYINHSCDPNVFFNTTTMELTAIKNITAQSEFTFFYPSTEWNMAQPFVCYCGNGACLRNIKGALYLTPSQTRKYRLTDFILEQKNKLNFQSETL